MGIGTQFILGGLLQGAGKALTDMDNRRRENALLALKRQYDLEDKKTTRDQVLDDRAVDRAYKDSDRIKDDQSALLRLDRAGEIARIGKGEDRAFELQKLDIQQGNAVELENVRAKNDADQKALDRAAEGDDFAQIIQGKSGTYYRVDKSGNARSTNIKGELPKNRSDEEEGGEGTIAGRRKELGGGAAEEPKSDAPKDDFLARYHAATEATAPRLFRNGKKIPLNEAMQLYRGR